MKIISIAYSLRNITCQTGQIKTALLDDLNLPIVTTDPFLLLVCTIHSCDGLSDASHTVIPIFLHIMNVKRHFIDFGVRKLFLIDKMILVEL